MFVCWSPTAEVARRTCEAELTVCFGERLEKWLLEGLKITLQKAAREHFGEQSDLCIMSLSFVACLVLPCQDPILT